MKLDVYEHLREAIEVELPAVSARVVAGPGIGEELLLVHPNTVEGSLGEDGLDTSALAAMRPMLREGGARLIDVGERRLFLEAHLPSLHLVVIGAVHIAIPLVTIAAALDYRTTVIDARGQFATDERFPHVGRLIEAWPDEGLAQVNLHPGVAAVVLAHDPKFEDPAMHTLLASDVGYIGAIGSRTTSRERRLRLAEAGFSDEQLDRIHGPIGLSIGAKTPGEIAVSIMGEIIAIRRGSPAPATPAPAAVRA
jgi:xanthine dehydrogenase accessory factor